MNLRKNLLLALIVFSSGLLQAQNKYQSLMWKVSGNGLGKPSYLYGTMHISGKMVFHLGDPFYDALTNVDVVALEMEPEAWLGAIFNDKSGEWSAAMSGGDEDYFLDGGYGDSPLPDLSSSFKIETGFQEVIRGLLMYDPALLNYMLFRYGDYGSEADFEEETWLDMYIYQTGKKLGKETIGLETFEQSDYFLKRAQEESMDEESDIEMDKEGYEELLSLRNQLEPAYRRQDLDLIDSLNKRTTSKSFDKYILVERNKVFIQTIDSVLKSGKSLFAGMGCAHLPGSNGIIEMLRERGYTVEAVNKGERNAKRREKLESLIYKRSYQDFSTPDGLISWQAPAAVYHLESGSRSSSWISLDIANGASFMLSRLKSYDAITHRDADDIFTSIDSLLYEAIPGDIISQRRLDVQGYPALEVINRSVRGAYQKKWILVVPGEILVLKLNATGEKVKNGYGEEFFRNLRIREGNPAIASVWTSRDGLFSCGVPGQVIEYGRASYDTTNPDFEAYSSGDDLHSAFIIRRHTVEDPEFIDEDIYELNRLADVVIKDNGLHELKRRPVSSAGFPAMDIAANTGEGVSVFTRLILQNLNYYVLYSFTSDSSLARDYFDSVRFTRKDHDGWKSASDSSLHFLADLPYDYETPQENFGYRGYGRKSDKNPFLGSNASTYLNVPGESDFIRVEFQRYHRFADGEDSLKFVSEKEDLAIRFGQKLESRKVEWNDTGCELLFTTSDTASVRRYMKKFILKNKSLYTLTASYDSILGPGDFVTRVFTSFEPIDTVFPYYHFRNRDLEYLDVVVSEDSATRAHAVELISEMDFSASSSERIRKLLDDMPAFEKKQDAEAVRSKLTAALAADTSRQNVDYVCHQYYRYPDSTDYQNDLLQVLLRMGSSYAWQNWKRLLLDEPPLVSDNAIPGSFSWLRDSLELVAPMIPDLMYLLAIDEYENEVYSLLADALDSNLVKPSIYASMLGQITMEARNELKRINASDETGYRFQTATMLSYCSLLEPFRKKPEVKAVFDKAYRSPKNRFLIDLMDFDLQHKHSLPDSVLKRVYAQEDQIIPLYKMLYSKKAAELFPGKSSIRNDLVAVYLRSKFSGKGRNEAKIDSVTVLACEPYRMHNHDLQICYIKYKKMKSRQWLGYIMVFDASDPGNLWPPYFESMQTIVLDDPDKAMEKLHRTFKALEESHRRRLYLGYAEGRMNFQWNY